MSGLPEEPGKETVVEEEVEEEVHETNDEAATPESLDPDEENEAGEVENGSDNKDQEEKIAALEKDIQDLTNRLLRVQADYDNFRRRTREEREKERQYRAQSIVEDLLPVLDNFNRALDTKAENEESRAIIKGMEMVFRQFQDALIKEGVKEIAALGEPFDPNKHQAVMQVESDDHESNTVVEVLQAGYELNGRVIRPSMVKVSL
ncbi:nucleotide exchange factor GrpE [Camelliibacillus cellulosilyticus]|uniref:Protein GrpE n=1 Tax=Camelliibacillus cellulosilyticus TaxID=2174486 RepID=A0ABV9GLE1_9BACL